MKLLDADYVLTEGAGWFDVKGFAIRIQSTDEGVVVDVFAKRLLETEPFCEPLASTYAFDAEAGPEEKLLGGTNSDTN